MLKSWGDTFRTSVICVDDFKDSVPKGRIYSSGSSDGTVFQSLIQFLTEMERILDEMDFPKPFTAVRTFGDPVQRTAQSLNTTIRAGKQATFAVKVLFRQNTSWQGSVVWLEKKKEQSFRSVLELILLLNSALQTP